MAVHQYVGARYVPKFYENSLGTSEWQSGVIYEPLTIVTYNGNSYTSKKYVPANIGDPSHNTAYWVATGTYNQQIQDLSDRVSAIEPVVETDNERMEFLSEYILNKKIVIFGDSYADEDIQWSTTIDNVWTFKFREIVEAFGATVTNYSRSSRGWCVKDNQNRYTGYEIIDATDISGFDTVILWLGLNDFYQGIWTGNYNSSNTQHIWGALNGVASKLRGKNVFVVTPMQVGGTSSIPCVTLSLIRIILANWARYNGFMLINGVNIPNFYKTSSYWEGIHPKNEYTHIIAEYIFQAMVKGGETYQDFRELKTYDATDCTNATNPKVTVCYLLDQVIYQTDCDITDSTQLVAITMKSPGITMFQPRGIALTNDNKIWKQSYTANSQEDEPSSNCYFVGTETTSDGDHLRFSFRGFSSVLGRSS